MSDEDVNLYYTDGLEDLNSESLFEVLYNSNKEELYVEFRTSADLYLYKGVPLSIWNALVAASSRGSFYATQIKGHYVSENLGDVWQFNYYAEDRDKGLTNRDEHVAAANVVQFPLSVPEPAPVPVSYDEVSAGEPVASSKYGVKFEFAGLNRTYKVDALDEADALRKLQDVSDALNEPFKIVSVTHYFA